MNKDEHFMRLAIQLAQKASDMGEVPVGALVVRDDEIISQAHNRREIDQDPCGHAELIAIREAAKKIGSWRLENCTVYVTLEPCAMCAGAMWLSRVNSCVFGCFDPKSGFMGSVADINQFKELNHKFSTVGGVLEEECASLLRTFFRRIRSKKIQKKD